MKLKIVAEFDAPQEEISEILRSIAGKVEAQLERAPGCICTHPEDEDLLRGPLGQRRGTIQVKISKR